MLRGGNQRHSEVIKILNISFPRVRIKRVAFTVTRLCTCAPTYAWPLHCINEIAFYEIHRENLDLYHSVLDIPYIQSHLNRTIDLNRSRINEI